MKPIAILTLHEGDRIELILPYGDGTAKSVIVFRERGCAYIEKEEDDSR